MRSPAAERSLRRLVTRLAAAEPDDVQQVLDALEPAQQAEVRALLDAYDAPTVATQPAPPPAPAEPAPVRDTSHLAGLSAWLAQRVAAADEPGTAAAGRMTSGALTALAQAARALPPETTFVLEAPAAPRRSFNPFRRRESKPWA
jgi:hypothetical protein